jgi:uncharacterized protein (TIGR02246 family)
MAKALTLGRGRRVARTSLISVSLLLLPAGIFERSKAQVQDDGIGGIIARADQGAVAEVNRHDAHALAERYWDDAIDVSPDGVVSGRSAIERRFAEDFKLTDPQDFNESIDKVQFVGDQGWLIDHFSDTRLAPDGSRHARQGYVAAVLEKRNGRWKASLHVITLAQ